MVGKPLPLETQSLLRKSRRWLWSVGALFVLLGTAAVGTFFWYAASRPCEVSAVQEASATLVAQINRYDDVYKSTTDAASRDSIVYPVAVLEQILMDTKQIVVPACMRKTKNELVNYMGSVIRAFEAFSAREADATIREALDASYTHFNNFFTELKAVNECAPYCIP